LKNSSSAGSVYVGNLFYSHLASQKSSNTHRKIKAAYNKFSKYRCQHALRIYRGATHAVSSPEIRWPCHCLVKKQKSLPDFAALEGSLTPDGIAFSGQLHLPAYNDDNHIVTNSLHKTPTTAIYLNNNTLYLS